MIDILIEKIREKNNPTVVGLDTRIDYVPEFIREKHYAIHGRNMKGAASAILEFNQALIDCMCDIVPAVKPQSAYYEMYGLEGIQTLIQTVNYAKSRGLYVIMDAKRGDIGATVEAYASAYLGKTKIDSDVYESAFYCDALTVNPYLGSDGVKPFIDACSQFNKSIFVLVKTSNKSSDQLQDLILQNQETVYTQTAKLVKLWGKKSIGQKGYSNVGAVVGATYPKQGGELRALMPNTFFLVPGYGAQGAGAKDVAVCFDKNGDGAVVNSSRGIMCAYINKKTNDFITAARDEALDMKKQLNSEIKK